MLVSLPTGLHGHPIDDSNVIDSLICKHQSELEFTRIIDTPSRLPANLKPMNYWIGEYKPDQYHAVELVSGENVEQFEQCLQSHQLYLPEHLAKMTPAMFILANKLFIEPASQTYLNSLSLPVLQSPFPSKSILRTLAYSKAEHEQSTIQHGVMMSIFDQGVLLSGESGLGKSGIALELISRGHSLVADDAPLLHRPPHSERIYAISSPLLADLLDVRAIGVTNISKLFGNRATLSLSPLDLVIELVMNYQPAPENHLSPFNTRTNILGLNIPHLKIPVSHVTNLALIVETITRNHVLYQNGYDASAQLIEQQRQLIKKQTQ